MTRAHCDSLSVSHDDFLIIGPSSSRTGRRKEATLRRTILDEPCARNYRLSISSGNLPFIGHFCTVCIYDDVVCLVASPYVNVHRYTQTEGTTEC